MKSKIEIKVLVLILLLSSCSNPTAKRKIEDEQVLVQQKIKLIETVLDGNRVIKETSESIIRAKAELGYPINIDSVTVERLRLGKQTDSLIRVKGKLEVRLDSLEIELKKY